MESEQELGQKEMLERDRAIRREKRLANFRRKFRCHICGKPCDGPRLLPVRGEAADTSELYEDWSAPGGLSQCAICRQWTCAEHLEHGICRRDAARLR